MVPVENIPGKDMTGTHRDWIKNQEKPQHRAGSDLTALRTTATLDGDDYLLNGEKLFITNVIPGRTAAVVVVLDGKPAVLVVDLPAQESEHFQVVPYGLYALRHAYNNGLKFNQFRVPRGNLLKTAATSLVWLLERTR